jgi:hypothetical protein
MKPKKTKAEVETAKRKKLKRMYGSWDWMLRDKATAESEKPFLESVVSFSSRSCKFTANQ